MQQLILSKRRRLGKTEPLRSPSSGKTRAKKAPRCEKDRPGSPALFLFVFAFVLVADVFQRLPGA